MTHIGHSEKVLVMRILIAVLVLTFCLQSWTKADDIGDFEIEGPDLREVTITTELVSKSDIGEKKPAVIGISVLFLFFFPFFIFPVAHGIQTSLIPSFALFSSS